MSKIRTALLLVVGWLLSQASVAGLFSKGVSDIDLAQVKRLGVVSALGNSMIGRSTGLTVFNNKSFKAALPNRDLDDAFTKAMSDKIVASERIKGEVVPLQSSALDRPSILEAARAQMLDVLVVMEPAEDTQFNMTGPGLTVYRAGFGKKVFTCNSMRVFVLRVADGKELTSASDYPCPAYANLEIWHDTWEEFSDAERQMVFAAMAPFVLTQIDHTLKALKLHARD